jgi:rubrerythrin
MASHKVKSHSSHNETTSRGAKKPPGKRTRPASQNGRQEDELNHARLVEFLSQMLAVEKGGVMLYEKALNDLWDEDLRDQLQGFLEQTRRHVVLCEEMLEQAGGSAAEGSPAAKAAEEKAEGLISVEVPQDLTDFNNIENLVLAETKDSWNWERLGELAKKIKNRELRSTINSAVREVARQERKHLSWSSDTLTELGQQMLMADREHHDEGYEDEVAEGRRNLRLKSDVKRIR